MKLNIRRLILANLSLLFILFCAESVNAFYCSVDEAVKMILTNCRPSILDSCNKEIVRFSEVRSEVFQKIIEKVLNEDLCDIRKNKKFDEICLMKYCFIDTYLKCCPHIKYEDILKNSPYYSG